MDAAKNADARHGAVKAAIDELEPLWRVERLIDEARSHKDYERADYLRDGVISAGAQVEITKDGTQITRLPNFDPAKFEALK